MRRHFANLAYCGAASERIDAQATMALKGMQ